MAELHKGAVGLIESTILTDEKHGAFIFSKRVKHWFHFMTADVITQPHRQGQLHIMMKLRDSPAANLTQLCSHAPAFHLMFT